MVPEHLLSRFDDDNRFEAERMAFAFYKAVESAYMSLCDKFVDSSRSPEVTAVWVSAFRCKTKAEKAFENTWTDYEITAGRA